MTEREIVKRERQAFVDAVYVTHNCAHQAWSTKGDTDLYKLDERLGIPLLRTASVHELAKERYPLPKVTRPRVVQDVSGDGALFEWKYENGMLWRRAVNGAHGWKQAENNSGMYINSVRVKLLADLIANPNKTVEE